MYLQEKYAHARMNTHGEDYGQMIICVSQGSSDAHKPFFMGGGDKMEKVQRAGGTPGESVSTVLKQ